MKTFVATPKDIKRNWFVVDAEDKILGRLASEVAKRLRGKHKPIYSPNLDTGDYIVVVNADKIRLTGNKRENKKFYYHTRYPGGIKSVPIKEELAGKYPERVVQRAIKGMMPKTRMGRKMLLKLKVYSGPEHPHAAQTPVKLELGA
ncbi:50S ribosomal protein L13 [Magnetococcales bacterium HHB-1]